MNLTEQQQVTVDAVTDALTGEHRKWIEKFAHESYRSYDDVMQLAKTYLETGEVVDTFDEFDDEFWVHYQAIVGKKLPDYPGSFYVCCARSGGG